MFVREEAPPGESCFNYVITPVDERLQEATNHFARNMVIFRCGENHLPRLRRDGIGKAVLPTDTFPMPLAHHERSDA